MYRYVSNSPTALIQAGPAGRRGLLDRRCRRFPSEPDGELHVSMWNRPFSLESSICYPIITQSHFICHVYRRRLLLDSYMSRKSNKSRVAGWRPWYKRCGLRFTRCCCCVVWCALRQGLYAGKNKLILTINRPYQCKSSYQVQCVG